jgi:hypothetical protein
MIIIIVDCECRLEQPFFSIYLLMTTNPSKPFPVSGDSDTCFAADIGAMKQNGIFGDVFGVQELIDQQIGVERPLQGERCISCRSAEVRCACFKMPLMTLSVLAYL